MRCSSALDALGDDLRRGRGQRRFEERLARPRRWMSTSALEAVVHEDRILLVQPAGSCRASRCCRHGALAAQLAERLDALLDASTQVVFDAPEQTCSSVSSSLRVAWSATYVDDEVLEAGRRQRRLVGDHRPRKGRRRGSRADAASDDSVSNTLAQQSPAPAGRSMPPSAPAAAYHRKSRRRQCGVRARIFLQQQHARSGIDRRREARSSCLISSKSFSGLSSASRCLDRLPTVLVRACRRRRSIGIHLLLGVAEVGLGGARTKPAAGA